MEPDDSIEEDFNSSDLDDEVKELMESHDLDLDTAERAKELIDEGLDEDDSVEIAEEGL